MSNPLVDILTDLRDTMKRVEAKVDGLAVVAVSTSRRLDELRDWLLEEEQARIGLGKSVMDHEVRLGKAANGGR